MGQAPVKARRYFPGMLLSWRALCPGRPMCLSMGLASQIVRICCALQDLHMEGDNVSLGWMPAHFGWAAHQGSSGLTLR